MRFRKAGVAWKRVDSKMLNGDDSRSSYRQSTPDFGKVVEIDIGGKDGFVSAWGSEGRERERMKERKTERKRKRKKEGKKGRRTERQKEREVYQ